jgi:hypothetical protein
MIVELADQSHIGGDDRLAAFVAAKVHALFVLPEGVDDRMPILQLLLVAVRGFDHIRPVHRVIRIGRHIRTNAV